MKKELPIAVQNLRKIWDQKKIELRFTQVEAAKKLGWSQGAISHYLNNITDLGVPAIIKLANFLDVDPRDIDPNIEDSLPSVEKKIVAYNANDMTKRIDETLISRNDDHSILVRIPRDWHEHYSEEETHEQGYMRLVPVSELKNPKSYAARLKGQKKLKVFTPKELPPLSQIHTLWSVVAYYYY